jgi:hypothetical protein
MRRAALALISCMALAAVGQEPKGTEAGSGPRITVDKSGSKTRVVLEQDITVKVDVAPKPSKACGATIGVEYEQRNTVARVLGAIENPQCAASHGDYTLVVTVRDANGELKTREFREPWERGDDRPVEFQRDYPIGENVELVRVRARGLHCTCDEVPPE